MKHFEHPYIKEEFFTKPYRRLIIGTFPPNPNCEERRSELPFFYGNVNSIWSIIGKTNLYPEYNFGNLIEIKKWLNDYSVGVTDVIKSCSRSTDKICSSYDKDLIISQNDFDVRLKQFILKNLHHIESILLTSGSDSATNNSALSLFKQLMGRELSSIDEQKLIVLPSPSGEFLRSVFSKAKTDFGLKPDFFNYLSQHYPEALVVAEQTFLEKQKLPKTKINRKGKEVANTIKRFPKCPDYPSLFRLDTYRNLLPKQRD